LNVIELRLPSLQERRDDLGMLATAILARLAAPGNAPVMAPEALEVLRNHTFPGNVRELENILERAFAFANNGMIEVADLALKPMVLAVAKPLELALAAALPELPKYAETPSPPSQSLADLADLPPSLPIHLDQVEREIICRALAKTGFNRTQAAELLGISFRQLRYRMQRLSIRENHES
jgi:two-component system, NtrC family, response regulator PilR